MRLSDVMSNAGLAGYAVVALVLFLVVFVAIVVRVFLSKDEFAHASRMPLDDPREKK